MRAFTALSITLLAAALAIPEAAAQTLKLDLGSVEGTGWSAGGVRVTWTGGAGASVEIDALEGFGQKLRALRLTCARFLSSTGTWRCVDGVLDGPERLAVAFDYVPAKRELAVTLVAADKETWHLSQTGDAFALTLTNARITRLTPFLPGSIKPSAGLANGRLGWSASGFSGDLALSGAAFANPAGLIAGEKLAGTLSLSATHADQAWAWRAALTWDAGAILFNPVYLADGGYALKADGRLQGTRLDIDNASVDGRAIGRARARAIVDWHTQTLDAWSVDARDLDLAGVRTLLPQTWLDERGLTDLELAGKADIHAGVVGGALDALRIALRKARAEVRARNIGIEGVDLEFTHAQATTGAFQLDFSRAHLRDLALGPVAARGQVRDGQLDIANLVVPIEDGVLALNEIEVGRTAGFWRARWRGALAPLSMRRLTAALGWHPMSGTTSAVLPLMRYAEDTAGSTFTAEGALLFKVFGGDARVDGIRIDNPFGRTPRLAANLKLDGLDLSEMTGAVKFGDISGKVDVTVRNLEMESWQPLAFDARVATSAGDFRKRISQRAVQNISSIGGAGAGAAVQASLLRFFDSFGYSRLGLSCRLANGICEMGGVGPGPNGGYFIIEGGGLPAVNVVGYNRFVGWQEMLDRIRAVIEGNSKMIVQ